MGKEDIRLHLRYLINEFRKNNGKHELFLDEDLSHHCKAHSESKVERINEIRNERLRGHTELHYWHGFEGENIGHEEGHEHPFQLAEKIFQRWLESPVHRQNILNARSHVGVDIAHRQLSNGGRRIFMTARFR